MTKIGFTGHQGLTEETTAAVEKELRKELDKLGRGFEGMCSLAEGSDQLFAQCVLDGGGRLVVVIPSEHYETTFSQDQVSRFRDLLSQAAKVIRLEFTEPSEDAFWAAGRKVVEDCDRVLAVWDGAQASGLGGTADVVRYAQQLGKDVTVFWPKEAKRS